MRVQTSFKITKWEESPFSEIEEAGKLTTAHITKTYHGDMHGESVLEYVMSYTTEGSASFVGYERFTGQVGDRSGSFVLRHEGKFEAGEARATCTVVADSGTGELSGIQGAGSFAVGHAEEYPMTFDFELP